MSPGKIAAHCAHAVNNYHFTLSRDYTDFEMYYKETGSFKFYGDTIIVLKAHEKDLVKWESEGYYLSVRDIS